MSTEKPNTPDIEVEATANNPVFASPEDEANAKATESKLHQASGKAQERLHNLENQFVSLSSQRQLNFVLGSLLIISALTAGFGMLISLILGTLMIVQAATGNMILNNFFDSMDAKHKKWLIPGLIGIIAFIFIAYLFIGLTAGE